MKSIGSAPQPKEPITSWPRRSEKAKAVGRAVQGRLDLCALELGEPVLLGKASDVKLALTRQRNPVHHRALRTIGDRRIMTRVSGADIPP